jgi:hypothetical protein
MDDNQWHQHDIMGIIIVELHDSWKWVVLIQLQLNGIVYMVNCNFATHATCMLALMTYKYNELQVYFKIQKVSCKASCKIPLFFIVTKWLENGH